MRRSRRLAPKDDKNALDPEPFLELSELPDANSRQEAKKKRRKEKLAARKLRKKNQMGGGKA